MCLGKNALADFLSRFYGFHRYGPFSNFLGQELGQLNRVPSGLENHGKPQGRIQISSWGVAKTQNWGFLTRCTGPRKINILSFTSMKGIMNCFQSWGHFSAGAGPPPLDPPLLTWKLQKAFSRPGKITEFGKRANIMEKSWNFKIPLWKNHGKSFCAARIFWKTITLCQLL